MYNMKKTTKKRILEGYSELIGTDLKEVPKKEQERHLALYRAVENATIKYYKDNKKK